MLFFSHIIKTEKHVFWDERDPMLLLLMIMDQVSSVSNRSLLFFLQAGGIAILKEE